jgi:hypothetical protein
MWRYHRAPQFPMKTIFPDDVRPLKSYWLENTIFTVFPSLQGNSIVV